jgi:hypothetical protein
MAFGHVPLSDESSRKKKSERERALFIEETVALF